MTIKNFFSFRENKFFWVNIILMIVIIGVMIYAILFGLDMYTQHGRFVEVPNVKEMSVNNATTLLKDRGLKYAVIDSSYVKTASPGDVLDQNPNSGQHVKNGRVVYLTVNSLNIPLRMVPDVADNSSIRQAQAKLAASGFKLATEEFVTGEKDWVYGVKYKGRELRADEKIPAGSTLTLLVGNGSREDIDADSLSVDENTIPEKSEDAVVDDSWF